MSSKRRSAALALVLAGLTAAGTAQQPSSVAARPNFTGKWVENLKASRTGDGKDLTAEFKQQIMTLDHADSKLNLVIDIKAVDPAFDRVLSFELSTEGRVREFELQGLRASGYARWEGSGLTTYTRRALPSGGTVEVLRTLTLAADGRSMKGKMRAWFDGQSADYSEVWEKQ